MSGEYQKSITFTIMAAKVDALENAVRSIWEASQDQVQTEMQRGANVDQLIYDAYLLLPEATKVGQSKEGFDDILG